MTRAEMTRWGFELAHLDRNDVLKPNYPESLQSEPPAASFQHDEHTE
jgi:hypothetical protein